MVAEKQKPVTVDDLMTKADQVGTDIGAAMEDNRQAVLVAATVVGLAFLVGYRMARKKYRRLCGNR